MTWLTLRRVAGFVSVCGCLLIVGSLVVSAMSRTPGADSTANLVTYIATCIAIVSALAHVFGRVATHGSARRAAVDFAFDQVKRLAVSPQLGIGRHVSPENFLPVRWSFWRKIHSVSETNLQRLGCGTIDALVESLLATRRSVIILGDAGSGKTTFCGLYRQMWSSRAHEHEIVPVYLSLNTWDVEGTSLLEWCTDETIKTGVRLGLPIESSRKSLMEALKTGRTRLFLDGFDEVPDRAQSLIIERLEAELLAPMVLLSRNLPLFSKRQVMSIPADVITLELIDNDDALDAIKSVAVDGSWIDLARRAFGAKKSALSKLLSNPLYLSLVLQLAALGRPSSSDLDPRGRSLADLERALLRTFVVAAVEAGDPRKDESWRSKRIAWLSSLARMMSDRRLINFTWWDTPSFVPWPILAIISSVAIGTVLRSAELLILLLYALMTGTALELLPLGLSPSLFIAGSVLVAVSTRGSSELWLRFKPWWSCAPVRFGGSSLIFCGLDAIVLEGDSSYRKLAVFPVILLASSLSFALLTLLSQAALDQIIRNTVVSDFLKRVGAWPSSSSRAVPRKPGFTLNRRRCLVALALGMFYSIGVMYYASSALLREDRTRGWGWSFILVTGVVTLVFLVATGYGRPLRQRDAFSARRSLFRNLRFGAWSAVAWTLAFSFATVASVALLGSATENTRLGPDTQLPSAMSWAAVAFFFTVLSFVFFGAAGAAVTIAGRFASAVVWLRLRGRLPLRVLSFLDWGSQQGILQRSGFAYAFKHDKLLEVLANWESRR